MQHANKDASDSNKNDNNNSNNKQQQQENTTIIKLISKNEVNRDS